MTERHQIARAGAILVATNALEDPNFARTVIYLLEHSLHGSLGVILNRPSELSVGRALPEWKSVVTDPAVLFNGGPMEPGGVLALGRQTASSPPATAPVEGAGWTDLGGDLGAIDLSAGPAGLGVPLDNLRLFQGYSGWGTRQLDAELSAGAWWVFHALPSDIFSIQPAQLRERVVRRQGAAWSAFLHAPDDASLN